MGGSKVDNVDLGKLLFKRIQVIGTALRTQPLDKKITLTKEFANFAIPKFEKGSLKPVLDSILDWNKANEAHERMEKNKNAGKIILRVK